MQPKKVAQCILYSGTYKGLTVAVKRMNRTLSEEDKILLKDVRKHDNIVIYYHIVRLLLKHAVQHFFAISFLGNRS